MDFESWLVLYWCTKPSFDYIHTSLANSSPAYCTATLWIIDTRLVRWSCGRREMKRSRWWGVRDTKRARSISLQPLDSLLSSLLDPTLTEGNNKVGVQSQLMNSTWWQVWGLRPRQNTPTGTGISSYWRVSLCQSVSQDICNYRKLWQSDQFQILAGYNHNLQDCLLMSRNVVIITRPDTWTDPLNNSGHNVAHYKKLIISWLADNGSK